MSESVMPRHRPFSLMSNEMLIFMHIPKTGGTTIANLLAQALRPATEIGGAGRLQEFLRLPKEEIAKFRLAYGPVPYGIHDFVPQTCRYAVFLRDPVDRLISAYYYIKRIPQHPHYASIAGGMSLVEFARGAVQFAEHNNTATRYLGSRRVMEWRTVKEVDREHLARAKQRLLSFGFVGFQERLNDDVAKLLSGVGAPVPRTIPRHLATDHRPSIQDIEPAAIDAIREANILDIELYEFARACVS